MSESVNLRFIQGKDFFLGPVLLLYTWKNSNEYLRLMKKQNTEWERMGSSFWKIQNQI